MATNWPAGWKVCCCDGARVSKAHLQAVPERRASRATSFAAEIVRGIALVGERGGRACLWALIGLPGICLLAYAFFPKLGEMNHTTQGYWIRGLFVIESLLVFAFLIFNGPRILRRRASDAIRDDRSEV